MNPKLIKITVILLTISIITYIVYNSLASTDKTGEIDLPKNLFIERIENEINNIIHLPNDVFNKKEYEKIKYYIEDDFENNRFSLNNTDNQQWKENLSKTLYAAYSSKFVNQATSILSQQEWQQKNLDYIEKETNILIQSEFLERGSKTDKDLGNINKAIEKYYEIKRFIASCLFEVKSNDMNSRFPLALVKNKIAKANQYRNNSLENSLTNNCLKLHEGLKEIPKKLLNIHERYMNNKISSFGNNYKNYLDYRGFADNLYNPIKIEIQGVNSDIYPTGGADAKKSYLLNIWEEVNKKALDYY
jgi:hypothetical protein